MDCTEGWIDEELKNESAIDEFPAGDPDARQALAEASKMVRRQ